MYEIQKTNLQSLLKELLKTRVYIGNSAGSIVACKNLSLGSPLQREYSKKIGMQTTNQSLEFAQIHIRPHFDVPGHPSTIQNVEEMIAEHNVTEPAYLIDDNIAIKVIDGEVEVISEGKWKKFN